MEFINWGIRYHANSSRLEFAAKFSWIKIDTLKKRITSIMIWVNLQVVRTQYKNLNSNSANFDFNSDTVEVAAMRTNFRSINIQLMIEIFITTLDDQTYTMFLGQWIFWRKKSNRYFRLSVVNDVPYGTGAERKVIFSQTPKQLL